MNFIVISHGLAKLAKAIQGESKSFPPEIQAEIERASCALLQAKSAMSRAHFHQEEQKGPA